MSDKIAYTVPEFAALFGKERTWGYRQTYAGKVNTITMFGTIMIPAAEVDRILAEAGRYGIIGNTLKRKPPKPKTSTKKNEKIAKQAWKKFIRSRQSPSCGKKAFKPKPSVFAGKRSASRKLIAERLSKK